MRSGFTMLEMVEEFDKRFQYVGNDAYILEMAQVFWETAKLCAKWLRSVQNGSNMWENDLIIWPTAEKYGKWLRDLGNRKIFWEMA